MRLADLSLRNYRRFEGFHIVFESDLTVIAARNGQGKTTVLEAAASALGPFVGAFDEGKSEHIRRTDARYGPVGAGPENEQNFPVVVESSLLDPAVSWSRELNGPKGRTTTKEASPLAHIGQDLQTQLRYDESVRLPVVAYYSSKRLWVHHSNTSRKAVLTQSRTSGYEDCLSSSSNFHQLQEWVRGATLADLQQQTRDVHADSNLGQRLRGIAAAVDTVLGQEGWAEFHYSFVFEELAMVHPSHGALPISMLSDGVRATVALTADLALRCARLNGYLGDRAPRETDGIVLIDEVDLHLHPAWQQHVVGDLQEAFPRVQFIVSTHSPQVLSAVSSRNIRVVYQDVKTGQWDAVGPDQEVLGLASSVALNEVMGVNPTPELEISETAASYTALIERGESESREARALRGRLEEVYGPGHRVLVDADRLIRFQRFKLRRDRSAGEAPAKGMD